MTNGYLTADIAGASERAPAFLLFHGTGGDERQFLDLGGELLPDARRIGVRGDVSEGGSLRYFRRLAEGRYDMADLDRATKKLAAWVPTVAPGVERIALGYSNGANVIAATLAEAPDTFDVVVLMHPLIPFELQRQPGLKGKRILITAGRHDPIAPAAATEDLYRYFDTNDASVSLVWHDGGHEIRRDELLAVRDFLKA